MGCSSPSVRLSTAMLSVSSPSACVLSGGRVRCLHRDDQRILVARHLEVGQRPAANSRISCSAALPSRSTTAAADLLAELVVRHGEGATCATAGWSISTSSTSSGRDLLAAAVDDLLQRPVMAEVALVVEHALVAGAEPAVRERLGVGLRVVARSRRHVRPLMTTSPSPPAGRLLAGIVHDRRPRPGRGGPTEPGLRAPAAAGWSPSGARPRSCRRPRSPAPKASSSSAITCGGERGRGGADEAQRRAGRRIRVALGAARIAWCMVGTAVYQVGSSSSSQRRTERVEAGRADHGGAGGQRGQQRRDQPVDVEQRHDVEAAVARRQLQRRRDVRRGQGCAVSERHDLRPRGRPRRVEGERGGVVPGPPPGGGPGGAPGGPPPAAGGGGPRPGRGGRRRGAAPRARPPPPAAAPPPGGGGGGG